MKLTTMNVFYFIYYKKLYFLYNDLIFTPKRKNFIHTYTPVNKYIINKIMN